jgi:TolB-like protein/Tfp pilus assembly protein PilF
MGRDEAATVKALKGHQAVLLPMIEARGGTVIDLAGDGILAEFASVVSALETAIAIQATMDERNADTPAERRMRFRIGINQGDVVHDDARIYGDGINIAARLQALADPGGICISGKVFEEVRDRVDARFRDLGEQGLKNIARPVRAYTVEAPAAAPVARPGPLGLTPSLAVLPFQNMSGDPEQDYFADGVVEDIITALSSFRSFAVIARNSSFVYKGRAVDVRQVAKELGVSYVLEGSVRRAGSRLRITAQLIEGTTGAHLWARNFDGGLDDVFDVQDRITESVASVIEPHIQSAEIARSRHERPDSVATYDIYLRVLTKLVTESAEDNAAAFALLNEALAREPDNAVLLGRAAWTLEHRITMGWPQIGQDDAATCAALARRGLKHAAGDARVMAQCGLALLQVAGEYDLGLSITRAAVEANVNDAFVITSAAVAALHCGSIDDALSLLNRVLRLTPGDPDSRFALTAIAHAYMIRGQYADAVAFATRSLAINPHYDATLWMLIAGNAHLGNMIDARRLVTQLLALTPSATVTSIRAGQPARDQARIEPILEGLRLAGLPEG